MRSQSASQAIETRRSAKHSTPGRRDVAPRNHVPAANCLWRGLGHGDRRNRKAPSIRARYLFCRNARPPRVQVFTISGWVTLRIGEAEELLWRKTCKQCHTLTISPGAALPQVAPANIKTQWMPHAKFDHDAHRGFSCVSCHAKALTSTEASDILLPGIAICKTCHGPGPGRADARCSECHTYHDWSKRNEVTPKFTLPALRTGQ